MPKSTAKYIYESRFYILAGMFLIHLVNFWPGKLMFDSEQQYAQALLGVYSDHHPPLMAFVWHYLAKLYPGAASMFILQTALLFAAMYVALKMIDFAPLAKRNFMSLLVLPLPLLPQIIQYQVIVLKDVQFALGFLLCAAILAYYTLAKKIPALSICLIFAAILLYSAGVKYQGQYCVLILCIWFGILFSPWDKLRHKICLGLFFYALVFITLVQINQTLVPAQHKNYSWQHVKFYDLAAISIAAGRDLLPDVHKTTIYSFAEMRNRFTYPGVDSLTLTEHPILKVSKDSLDMHNLRKTWLQAVVKHPQYYLKHRFKNIAYMLFKVPFFNDGWNSYAEFYAKFSAKIASKFQTSFKLIAGLGYYTLFAHGTTVFVGIVYLFFGLVTWRQNIFAPILVAYTTLGLSMLLLLFFMSMAGTPRYTFITVLMINSAHFLASAVYPSTSRVKAQDLHPGLVRRSIS